jgi:peptidoglycan/LPS O-acetylase OafA/YrhL
MSQAQPTVVTATLHTAEADRRPNGTGDPLARASRVPSVDSVKGLLVLAMVVYHVLSIASTGGVETFRYIRFVSGSFIFLAGYVISRFVSQRFERERAAVAWQLASRGIKVLVLFTALNLAIAISGLGNVDKQQLDMTGFFERAGAIYLIGDSRASSFLILLSIGYLLMVSPLVLLSFSRARTLAPLIVLVAALILAAQPSITRQWPNADLWLIGLAGMAIGAPVWATRLEAAPAWRVPWLIGAFAVVVWFTGRFGDAGALYIVGVAMILKLLHDGVARLREGGAVTRELVRMGRYSLFGYIAQIAVIQLMFRALGSQRWSVGLEVLALGLAAALTTALLCVAMDRLRASSRAADTAYRWVFM